MVDGGAVAVAGLIMEMPSAVWVMIERDNKYSRWLKLAIHGEQKMVDLINGNVAR